jgi:fatty-acid peroxygenase
VSLFDESARILATTVTRWTGVPEGFSDRDALAADLLAMAGGFAAVGARLARAISARRRRERWLAELIAGVRRKAPSATPLSAIANHLEAGHLLEARTAAVELLNIIGPTTAVAWYVAFARHALDRWPVHRARLRAGDEAFTRAFVQEVRRFYPFVPFLAGRAVRDLRFQREDIARGTLVLLDVYGQHHDPRVWPEPYAFRPDRFLGRPIGEFELIPQGGGDPRAGHRCPGEQITVALLGTMLQRVARLDHYLPPQDMTINLSRVPARPRSGITILVP